MALFSQIVSMVCFSITNSLWKPPQKTLPIPILILSRTTLTISFFVILILSNLYFQFDFLDPFYKPVHEIRWQGVLIAFGICAVNYWGLYFYNKSLSHTYASVTMMVKGLGKIITILFAVLVFHETITVKQSVIILLFFISVWFLENLDVSFLKFKPSKGVGYAFLSLLFWSTWPLFSFAFAEVGVLWFCLIMECTVFVLSFLMLCLSGGWPTLTSYKEAVFKNSSWIIALGILGSLGVLFSNMAMSLQNVTSYAILGMIQPLISLGFAAIFLKERLSKFQYVGVLIILLTMLI